MSGICGFINFSKKLNKDHMLNIVDKMNSALYNSEDGFIYSSDYCVIGKNNNFYETEDYIIFFYGDLYNCKSLSQKYCINYFNEAHMVFEMYKCFNVECFKELSGKFVFIIFNKLNGQCTIVRDKVGSKQMYYYFNDDCFVFCTELKALLNSGIIPKEIDKTGLSQYLQLTYTPAPQTIIKNVKKIKPSIAFCIESNKKIAEKVYWQIEHNVEESHNDFENCKNELKNLLYSSVKEKLDLYNDSGAFLSGGFDSSIVVGVMSDVSDLPIKTFTVGFESKQYDESELASIVARANNTDHTVLQLDWSKVVNDIDIVLNGIDEPFADSSLIATYAVCKLAKQYTNVAFMGDAGDELFAGYDKYLISYYCDMYKKIPKFIRKGIVEPLSKLIPRKSTLYRKINKVVSSADMSQFEQRKRMMSLGFKPEELKNLMLDGYVDEMAFIKEQYDFLKSSDEQTCAQYVDFKTVLEGDMLPKVEIASRLSGLKTCAPILDDNIIEFSYSIPTKFKINKTERKIILKETFKYLLPKELFNAPKHGFGVPIGEWLETNFKEQLLEFASEEFITAQGLFNHEYINMIIRNHFSHKENRYSELWAFFVFQNWYKNFKN